MEDVAASARAGQELETTEVEIGNNGDPLSGAVSTKRRKVLKWLKHAEAENLSDFIPVFATLARAALRANSENESANSRRSSSEQNANRARFAGQNCHGKVCLLAGVRIVELYAMSSCF